MKKGLFFILFGIMLFAIPIGTALAYSEGSFTITVPNSYEKESKDGLHTWKKEDESMLILSIKENTEALNLFKAKEEDAQKLAQELENALQPQLEEEYGVGGITINIVPVQAVVANFNGQPCLLADFLIEFRLEGQLLLNEFQRTAVFTSKEHVFSLTHTAVGATGLAQETQNIISSFQITEETFTAKAGSGFLQKILGFFTSIWGFIILGIIAAVLILLFIFKIKQKKQWEEAEFE